MSSKEPSGASKWDINDIPGTSRTCDKNLPPLPLSQMASREHTMSNGQGCPIGLPWDIKGTWKGSHTVGMKLTLDIMSNYVGSTSVTPAHAASSKGCTRATHRTSHPQFRVYTPLVLHLVDVSCVCQYFFLNMYSLGQYEERTASFATYFFAIACVHCLVQNLF